MPERKQAKGQKLESPSSGRSSAGPKGPRAKATDANEQPRIGGAPGSSSDGSLGVTIVAPPRFMGLDRERETYSRLKSDLIKTAKGCFVVIQGVDVEGPLETYGAALRAGYKRFGLDRPFLVQQVLDVEPVGVLSRDLVPCQA